MMVDEHVWRSLEGNIKADNGIRMQRSLSLLRESQRIGLNFVVILVPFSILGNRSACVLKISGCPIETDNVSKCIITRMAGGGIAGSD